MDVEGERRSSRIEQRQTREGADLLMGLRSAPPVFDFPMGPVDVYDPLTTLAERIYGKDAVDKWKTVNRRNVRDIWELEVPKAQCYHSIGSPYDKKCWLCGIDFYTDIDGLKPICEHILPIAQATFFLELYSKSSRVPIADEEVPNIIRLEYGWAHDICNAIKNDLVFIEQDPTKPEGIVRLNKYAISEFLNKLISTKSTRNGVATIKTTLSNQQYYTFRLSAIQDRVNEIVQFINKPGRDNSNLLILARTASFMDPTNVNKTFADMVNIPKTAGSKTFRRKKVKRTSKLKRTMRHKRK